MIEWKKGGIGMYEIGSCKNSKQGINTEIAALAREIRYPMTLPAAHSPCLPYYGKAGGGEAYYV